MQASPSDTAPTCDANAIELKFSSPATEHGLPVEFNRDGLAVNSFDEAGVPGLGYGPGTVTPGGFDSNVSTADSTADCQTVRKLGLQSAPEAPLAMHIQASATPKCLDQAGAGNAQNWC